MSEPLSQTDALTLIKNMAEVLQMPDPGAARTYMRLAIIDYSHAYRNAEKMSHSSVLNLIDNAWLHLEKAVKLGSSRSELEDHFYRIRTRFALRQIPK